MNRMERKNKLKKLLLPFGCAGLLFLAPKSTAAQVNLVPNGSFEAAAWCPSGYNNTTLRTATSWTQPTQGTPDHFKACSGDVGVPRNMFGDQMAVDGEAYAGLVIYSASKPAYREYLQVELTRTLKRGEWVCVSWWACAADEAKLVADGLGVHLGIEALRSGGELVLPVQPQVENPRFHMVSDRHSWIRFSDVFQAAGGERYLTLGNFRPPRENRVLERRDAGAKSNPWAYVYIDDVRIEPVDVPTECSCLNATYQAEATDPPWEAFLLERIALESVLFDFDASVLTNEAKQQLEAVAATMRANRYLVMQVNGHTDEVGTDGYNLLLSEARAQRVLDYLIERGVDPNRLELAYHGSRLPAADNATPDGRKQNRRVEFELLQHAFLPTQ